MQTISNADIALGRSLADALLERYSSWSEERAAVAQAYRRWADCDHAERGLAHASYLAALDREEQASRAYAEELEWVSWISARCQTDMGTRTRTSTDQRTSSLRSSAPVGDRPL